MSAEPSLIQDLELALTQGSSAQRAEILRRVTDLFLGGINAYSDDHVAVFDDVMYRLIEGIERYALIRLSRQLAPEPKAPIKVVESLAQHDDIEISGPLIERSTVLSDNYLVHIAQTKGQEHLAALAGRAHVSEAVTDVLVERGDEHVTVKVAGNAGARFSRHGFMRMADKAESNEKLAELVANRQDIPPDVFEHLLSRATEVVKARLLRNASPEMRMKISSTLADIARQVKSAQAQQASAESGAGSGHSAVTLAHRDMQRLKTQLADAVASGDKTETIEVLARLSKLPSGSVRNLLRQEAKEGLLILCKAMGIGWPDVKRMLTLLVGMKSDADLRRSFERYIKLSPESANRVIRFVKSCKAVSKADLQRML